MSQDKNTNDGKSYQLWGGCFDCSPADILQKLNRSFDVDKRLYQQDIKGSKVYANALCKAGLINKEELNCIQNGLVQVLQDLEKEFSSGSDMSGAAEDIHTEVEARLVAVAGEAGLRLHTGRSRNDQVATDTRLWLLDAVEKLKSSLLNLIQILGDRAEKEIDIIMPGYTHLQRAQPIRWSHFLLSHAWSLRDDLSRLVEQIPRLSRCPLGSGALAGCAFPLDRRQMAQELGFQDVTHNSMYAVGNRDFVAEFLFWCSLCSNHLSRFSEDLILYGTKEFGFVQFSEQFSTGSSLMPQKRNPDGLELVRGLAGALQGEAFGFMATLKGIPSTYNKDLQGDKESLFRSFDKLQMSLEVTSGIVNTLKVDRARCLLALDGGMLSTDLAHYLVRKGVPFRTAHHHAGRALRLAEQRHTTLQQLSLQDLQSICASVEADVCETWSWESSVEQYGGEGGTARQAVLQQLNKLREGLDTTSHHTPNINL